jgi:hypothetical protein
MPVSARNRYHTAMESLNVALAELDGITPTQISRVKRYIIRILHTNENIATTDPNHPYTRFASSDAENNMNRLHAAMDETFVSPDDNDIRPFIAMMFEVPDTSQYNCTRTLLRTYRAYAESNGFSESSDSDDSDDS